MRVAAIMTMLTAVLALGACAKPELDTIRAPDTGTFFRRLSVTNLKERSLAPVTAEDLVDTSGRCAGSFAPPQTGLEQSDGPLAIGPHAQADLPPVGPPGPGQPMAAAQEPVAPTIAAPITLEMTECEVVKRAGIADKVDIGANERGERSTTLVFLQGMRPGIYRFAEGRLKSMERVAAPPAPAKPAKPAGKKKPRSTRAAVR